MMLPFTDNPQRFRVVLADPFEVVRVGLRQILQAHGSYTIVGEAPDTAALLRVLEEQSPGLIILDPDLPGVGTALLLREIHQLKPDAKVLIFTSRSERIQILRILKAGSHGYLQKSAARDEVIQACGSVLRGHTYLSPAAATMISTLVTSPEWAREPHRRDDLLSHRETEVLRQLVEGKTSKEIASTLNVAVRTVESHRAQLMRKLDLRSVAALTKYAIREGITSPHPA